MTKHKDLKRVVREYASRTGRSYADARRLLDRRTTGGETMNSTREETPFKTVHRQKLGFSLSVPAGWAEFPALLSNSPYEVARFAYRDHASHLCIVFRMPGSPGLHPLATAEQAIVKQRAQGFDHFVLTEVDVGKRRGVLLSFDKTTDQASWSAREYFVGAGSLVYCLGLGSGDASGDAAVFDSMAERFEVYD
jgi:hypothetical protein